MEKLVPFNDLSRLEPNLRKKIIQRTEKVVSSGNYILGTEVEKFEGEFANFIGSEGSVAVANGTDAIILSLLAAGVVHGDVILTMANAGSYTTIAAKAIGVEPIFVDVAKDSLQMNLKDLQISLALAKTMLVKPKAVVVTHLFGQLNSQIKLIANLCKREGIVLIEDCAQAIGATDGSNMAGTFGSLSTFSFFPTKNLGALGDGGAVSGTDMDLLLKVRMLRQYGWSKKYSIDIPFGRNSRLDEIQAAILRVKLPYVEHWNHRRREIYALYLDAASRKVRFYSSIDQTFVGHLCVITVEGLNQKQLSDFFSSRGIQTSIHFPIPDHLQEIELKYRGLVALPETEQSCSNLVTLPLFPELTTIEVQRICEALGEVGN